MSLTPLYRTQIAEIGWDSTGVTPPRLRARNAWRPLASTTHFAATSTRCPSSRATARRAPDLAPCPGGHLQQVLVELRAVELQRRRAGELGRSHLRRLPQTRNLVV